MDTLEARGVVAGFLLLATNVPISAFAMHSRRQDFCEIPLWHKTRTREAHNYLFVEKTLAIRSQGAAATSPTWALARPILSLPSLTRQSSHRRKPMTTAKPGRGKAPQVTQKNRLSVSS
jgi:hypothetical protein